MARLDAFSAQIVKFVREMPDEALLELVKEKLGVLAVSAAKRSGHRGKGGEVIRPSAKAKAITKGSQARARRAAAPSPERRELLDEVERVVRAGAGVSASEVAQSVGIPQTRAAAALKQLKLAKRIFQGGDRRFARYACDARTAEQASTVARRTAKGPITIRPAAPKPDGASSIARPRKRSQPVADAPTA